MFVFFVQSFILASELIDLGGQLVDPRQALAQQGFKSADRALLVFYFAPQANNCGAQSVVLSHQSKFGAGRLVRAHTGQASTAERGKV